MAEGSQTWKCGKLPTHIGPERGELGLKHYFWCDSCSSAEPVVRTETDNDIVNYKARFK